MTPSRYQCDILSFQQESSGNARVTARAGSGKSTTLCMAAGQLSPYEQANAVFVAFNRHIAEELRGKLPRGMDAYTIHSLALKAIRPRFNPSSGNDWIEANKYRKLARTYWRKRNVDPWKNPEVVPTTEDLLRFTMLTLTDHTSDEAMRDTADRFGVTPYDHSLDSYIEAVRTLLTWGLEGTPDGNYRGAHETISYDDMLYYANTLDVPAPRYGMVYVDEAQDLNNAQREFVLRMLNGTGRMIAVGDDRQAIYAFAGADHRAFERIAEQAQTEDFSLPICYRCPSSHIRLAQEIVPDIFPRDGAPEGRVEEIRWSDLFENTPITQTRVREGDLILCRTTAPLIDLAFELIGSGIPAMVRGREIGAALTRIVDAVSVQDGYSWPDFLRCLREYRAQVVSSLSRIEDNELAVENFTDRASSVECVYQRALAENVRDAAGLKRFIESLFDEQRGAVVLSTVHKAKGLEAERVFIIRRDLMPHPRAKRDHERVQEDNLLYVSLTRSKSELYFVQGA